jgi:hypothetical protein
MHAARPPEAIRAGSHAVAAGCTPLFAPRNPRAFTRLLRPIFTTPLLAFFLLHLKQLDAAVACSRPMTEGPRGATFLAIFRSKSEPKKYAPLRAFYDHFSRPSFSDLLHHVHWKLVAFTV